MESSSSDVVITGYGATCNMGDEVAEISEKLKNGVGGRFIRWDEAVRYQGRCQLIGLCETDVGNDALGITTPEGRFMGRQSRLALYAARKALAQSGCSPEGMAVFVGSGTGDNDTHDEIRTKLDKSGNMRRVSPAVVPKLMASTVSANLATVLQATGPSCTLTAACAGGAYNIVMAALLLQSGSVESAIAGGTESAHITFYAGFDSMRAYNSQDNDSPERASRPYSADRAGFIFSEGAGVLVLETRAAAERRGAPILGILRGFGMSSDGAGQMVAPSAAGGLRAMQAALSNARVKPEDLDYINTHGTSTPVGDISEMKAIRELLGGRHLPYSSIKGYTGHSVSGAGALEAIFTTEMLREGWVAPCINISELDPALADYSPVMSPQPLTGTLAMSNSFGFGGTNISLVLGAA